MSGEPIFIEIEGMDEPSQAIIVTGNPVDGLGFIGPFPDWEAADEYAKGLVHDNWWIAHLDAPDA